MENRNIKKFITIITLVILLGTASVFAVSSDDTGDYVDDLKLRFELDDNSILTSIDDQFHDFNVEVDNPFTSKSSSYKINFTVKLNTFLHLYKGVLVYEFSDNFDLSLIESVEFSDDFLFRDYKVSEYKIKERSLFIYLSKIKNYETTKSFWQISCSFNIKFIKNPQVAGFYSLIGTFQKEENGDNEILIGPTESELFEITPSDTGIVELRIFPDSDITVQAGENIEFEVIGIYNNGQEIYDLDYSIFLTSESDQIGYFTQNVLNVEKIGQGQVKAIYNNLSVESGVITVVSGSLSEIELSISHDQVVGYPLIGEAYITLFDNYGNLKTDYDLSLNPIELRISEGSLSKSIFSDNSLLVDGTINLSALDITYLDNSATVSVYAQSASVNSNLEFVSFSGYEIIGVYDSEGNEFNSIQSGQQTKLQVLVQNNGTKSAWVSPSLINFYESTNETSETEFSPPGIGGLIDNVELILPPHANEPINDNLYVILNSIYNIEGTEYPVVDSVILPFTVITSISPEITVNNLSPIVVEAGNESSFSFNISLDNTFPYQLSVESSQFKLSETGFSSITSPIIENNLILQGENEAFSGIIYIPESLAGTQLIVEFDLSYKIIGWGDEIFEFHSTFDGTKIEVTSKPILNIENIVVLSPNAPKVNIGQEFIISAQISNLSDVSLENIPFKLYSDGQSIFDSEQLINISSGESIEINFNIVAGDEENLSERFYLEINSPEIAVDQSQNNSVFVVIEKPAQLDLEYDLIGYNNSVIRRNEIVTLLVNLNNSGSSEINSGEYLLNSTNKDFEISSQVVGEINTDKQLRFDITTPDYNTSTTIEFSITNLPVELNTGMTIPIASDNFSFDINVFSADSLIATRILNLEVVAPNAPNINVSQDIQLRAIVENLSNTDIENLRLHLKSDGQSYFETETVVSVKSNSQEEILIDVTVAEDSSTEMFTLNIISPDVEVLDPVDNTALIIKQTPADLNLTYDLIGVNSGVINPGHEFTLAVELHNNGTEETSPVHYEISTDKIDFGDKYSSEGIIYEHDLSLFTFVAPIEENTYEIIFNLLTVPTALNTGSQAKIDRQSFSFVIKVESVEGDLLVDVQPVGTNLIIPGRSKEMFELNLTNRINISDANIKLNRAIVTFMDENHMPVNLDEYLNTYQSGFYVQNKLISTSQLDNNKLALSFEDIVIQPGYNQSVIFKALFEKSYEPSVNVIFDYNSIDAVYEKGPLEGQNPVISSLDNESSKTISFVFKGSSLEESVIVENNPFDPEKEPLRFSFELDIASAVQYRIFTLMGEEVFSENVSFGSEGATLGENIFEWDADNNNGHKILNGVYIVMIKIMATGETVKSKVAVIR